MNSLFTEYEPRQPGQPPPPACLSRGKNRAPDPASGFARGVASPQMRGVASPRTRGVASLRMRSVLAGFVALVAVIVSAAPSTAKMEKGSDPPQLNWVTVSGDTMSWSSLRGDRPLVMVFWATWCRTCKKDWPKLQKIEARYRDAEHAPAWAAVAMEDDARRVERVARERGLPGTILADTGEQNGKQLGIKFVPTVCILDRAGRVAYFGSPNLSRIDALLGQYTRTGKDPSP